MIIIADTSGLFAALDVDQPVSDFAYQAIQDAGLTVISPLVLAELDHLARRSARLSGQAKTIGSQRARAISSWIATEQVKNRIVIPQVTGRVLADAVAVMDQYRDLHLDLADAVNVVLALEYDTNVLLTLDERDFRAIHPLGGYSAFHLLPADRKGKTNR